MGTLVYAGSSEYSLDDRTLAHVKIAVAHALRHGEGFFLSWDRSTDEGSGRVSLWLAPAIPLAFRFAEPRSPKLSLPWLEALRRAAESEDGLRLFAEGTHDPDEPAARPAAPSAREA
ncbi:DUF7882 family protein [Leucobacter sp. M11]|uniref:DUF7882 family protein n=1 Tax=Leucobacter sp. M11 TaxID=2993565 RepID=UPI002D7E96A6|nr:hypothetical protein [Leucobacter sp. M11]MEB4614081.1 hypothetical protein [Leucobacter sp. M11]